jgi:hypothetical protein
MPRFGPEWMMGTETFAAPHEGAQLMLRKFPFLARLVSKLLYELLPAAIASVVGGMLTFPKLFRGYVVSI